MCIGLVQFFTISNGKVNIFVSVILSIFLVASFQVNTKHFSTFAIIYSFNSKLPVYLNDVLLVLNRNGKLG